MINEEALLKANNDALRRYDAARKLRMSKETLDVLWALYTSRYRAWDRAERTNRERG